LPLLKYKFYYFSTQQWWNRYFMSPHFPSIIPAENNPHYSIWQVIKVKGSITFPYNIGRFCHLILCIRTFRWLVLWCTKLVRWIIYFSTAEGYSDRNKSYRSKNINLTNKSILYKSNLKLVKDNAPLTFECTYCSVLV